jgi:hypothetical protein
MDSYFGSAKEMMEAFKQVTYSNDSDKDFTKVVYYWSVKVEIAKLAEMEQQTMIMKIQTDYLTDIRNSLQSIASKTGGI